MKEISVNDLASTFGESTETFSSELKRFIDESNLRYRNVSGFELEQLLLRIMKRIDEDKQVIGEKQRTKVWELGWKENLDEFRDNNYNEDYLVPKFIRARQPVRWKQDYIFPEEEKFELLYVKILRRWLFEKYFANVENVYEFGCGTGFNLLEAARIFPDKSLHGTDFVQSSVDLVNEISAVKKLNLSGHIFNMLSPDYNYRIKQNSGVFTFGALEQLASDIDKMFDYLIEMSPNICFHVEPSIELYDENNLSDYLAKKFQGKRGYTEGIISVLKRYEELGKVEILKIKRLQFGSLFMEGYNLIVWRPVEN